MRISDEELARIQEVWDGYSEKLIPTLVSDLRDDRARLKIAKAALEWIVEPLVHIEQEAKKSGAILNISIATMLANDGSYLKSKARQALEQLK